MWSRYIISIISKLSSSLNITAVYVKTVNSSPSRPVGRNSVFRFIACCDLDLWSQKLISTSTNPNTYVTKIGQNSLHWFVRYGVHKVFGSLPPASLTFDLLTQNLTSTSMYPNTSVTKIGWNSLYSFLRNGTNKVFGRYSCTHSQMDRSDYRMPPATFFTGDRGIKIIHL